MRACSHCFTLKYCCFKVRGMRIYTYSIPYKRIDLPLHHISQMICYHQYIHIHWFIHQTWWNPEMYRKKWKRSPFICLHGHHGSHQSPDPKTSCTRKCCSCCGSWYSRVIHPNAIWTNIFTDKKKWGSKLIQVFVHQLSDENEDQLLDTLKKKVCLSWFK